MRDDVHLGDVYGVGYDGCSTIVVVTGPAPRRHRAHEWKCRIIVSRTEDLVGLTLLYTSKELAAAKLVVRC